MITTIYGHNIIYQRTTETDISTSGTFTIPGTNITGYMLEPPGPSTNTANQNRRIPAGVYHLIANPGSVTGYRLYNDLVPMSRAVLLHSGNTPSQTIGCLLPGKMLEVNFVGDSKNSLKEIMNYFSKVGLAGATITIIDIPEP